MATRRRGPAGSTVQVKSSGDRPKATYIIRPLALCGQLTNVFVDMNEIQPRGYTTVLKLLQIMTEKGLVDRDEKCRPRICRHATRGS